MDNFGNMADAGRNFDQSASGEDASAADQPRSTAFATDRSSPQVLSQQQAGTQGPDSIVNVLDPRLRPNVDSTANVGTLPGPDGANADSYLALRHGVLHHDVRASESTSRTGRVARGHVLRRRGQARVSKRLQSQRSAPATNTSHTTYFCPRCRLDFSKKKGCSAHFDQRCERCREFRCPHHGCPHAEVRPYELEKHDKAVHYDVHRGSVCEATLQAKASPVLVTKHHALGCGLCEHAAFQTLQTWKRHHYAHCEDGATIGRWDLQRQVQSLYQQPALSCARNTIDRRLRQMLSESATSADFLRWALIRRQDLVAMLEGDTSVYDNTQHEQMARETLVSLCDMYTSLDSTPAPHANPTYIPDDLVAPDGRYQVEMPPFTVFNPSVLPNLVPSNGTVSQFEAPAAPPNASNPHHHAMFFAWQDTSSQYNTAIGSSSSILWQPPPSMEYTSHISTSLSSQRGHEDKPEHSTIDPRMFETWDSPKWQALPQEDDIQQYGMHGFGVETGEAYADAATDTAAEAGAETAYAMYGPG